MILVTNTSSKVGWMNDNWQSIAMIFGGVSARYGSSK